jgi:hypothetical protein
MSEESNATVESPESAETPVETGEAVEQVDAVEVSQENQELSDEELVEIESQLDDEIDEAMPDATEAEKQKVKEWVLKGADGNEIKITDEQELLKRAQMGIGAEHKFEEAAALKKDVAKLVSQLKENPWEVLQELGYDPLELSQKRLAEEFERQQKSPEELEREEQLKELENLRRKEKEYEEKMKQMEYNQIVKEEHQALEQGMLSALEEANLPAKPIYIKKMASIMQSGLSRNINITPKEALKIARQDVVDDLRGLLEVAPDEQLEDLIGQGTVKRIRRRYANLAKSRLPSARQVQDTGVNRDSIEEANSSKKPKGTIKDWLQGKVTLD